MNGPGGMSAWRTGKCPAEAWQREAGVATRDQPWNGWTVVPRRQPARMVEGRVRGPYPIAADIATYEKHLRLHQETETAYRRGTMTDAG